MVDHAVDQTVQRVAGFQDGIGEELPVGVGEDLVDQRPGGAPAADEEKAACTGLALAQATKSATVFTRSGAAGPTTNARGVRATTATGVRSVSGS